MNFLQYPIKPKKPLKAFTDVGMGQFCMTSIFLGSFLTPRPEIECSKYSTSSQPNTSFAQHTIDYQKTQSKHQMRNMLLNKTTIHQYTYPNFHCSSLLWYSQFPALIPVSGNFTCGSSRQLSGTLISELNTSLIYIDDLVTWIEKELCFLRTCVIFISVNE